MKQPSRGENAWRLIQKWRQQLRITLPEISGHCGAAERRRLLDTSYATSSIFHFQSGYWPRSPTRSPKGASHLTPTKDHAKGVREALQGQPSPVCLEHCLVDIVDLLVDPSAVCLSARAHLVEWLNAIIACSNASILPLLDVAALESETEKYPGG